MNKKYTICYDDIVADVKISRTAQILYCKILDLSEYNTDEEGKPFCSAQDSCFADYLGTSAETVNETLAELKENGYISMAGNTSTGEIYPLIIPEGCNIIDDSTEDILNLSDEMLMLQRRKMRKIAKAMGGQLKAAFEQEDDDE